MFLSCYNLFKNNCDGRCQGCSSCPICDNYHGITTRKSNRIDMILYMTKNIIENIRFKIFLRSKKGKLLIKEISNLVDKYKQDGNKNENPI